jgi:hypothetical protein
MLVVLGIATCFAQGCAIGESYRITDVVINSSSELQGKALLSGDTGMLVEIEPLIQALGGTSEFVGDSAVIVSLNGKRFLMGFTQKPVPFDNKITGTVVVHVNGQRYFTGPNWVLLLTTTFSKGDVYRDGGKVFVKTR